MFLMVVFVFPILVSLLLMFVFEFRFVCGSRLVRLQVHGRQVLFPWVQRHGREKVSPTNSQGNTASSKPSRGEN